MNQAIELQKALYKSLSTICSVYEVIPKGAKFPFITLSGFSKEEDFTKTDTNRFNLKLQVDGWTKGKSSIQSKTIEENIYKLVKKLEIENLNIELISLEMNTTISELDSSGETIFHSIQEFKFTINQKEK